MQNVKHVVLVAGEESGDAHAALLIKQLKNTFPKIRISGIGGSHMKQAGAELISDLAQYGVTGFSEVIRYLKVIRNALNSIKKHLKANQPDLLILVDYPGFNLRLAQYAKKTLGIKIIYYISPQIWAWKANRIHAIKKYIDKMAVILPFEKELYQKAGVPVAFVGHPLAEKIPLSIDSIAHRLALNLPQQQPLIALLPGSRNHEVERHMPVLVNTMRKLLETHPNLHFVMPIAETITPQKITHYFRNQALPIHLIKGKAIECMAASDFVIVASGTASLECALLKKPMCIIYKSTWLTYFLAMKLIKVKYLGLCNLLLNKMLVPEFLQYDCNSVEISRYVSDFFNNPSLPTWITDQLNELRHSMSTDRADCSLSDLIAHEMIQKNDSFNENI